MESTQTHEPGRTRALTGHWRVVADRSALGFETRVLFGLIAVHGRYARYGGTLTVDDAGEASGRLQIEAAALTTGIQKRDRHLATSDFFAAARFPHLTFDLASLVVDEHRAGHVTGTLTIRDRRQPIDAPVRISPAGPDGLRIDADIEVDHRAAGFEIKRLPRAVRAKVSLTLARDD